MLGEILDENIRSKNGKNGKNGFLKVNLKVVSEIKQCLLKLTKVIVMPNTVLDLLKLLWSTFV